MKATMRLTRSIRHRVVAVTFVLVLALGLLLVPAAGGATNNRSHGNHRHHAPRRHQPSRFCTKVVWTPGEWHRHGWRWHWHHGKVQVIRIPCPPSSP